MVNQPQVIVGRLDKLRRHSEVLRQIHSNKAFKCERRQRLITITTMVAAAGTTFFGFLGFEKIHTQIKGLWNVSEQAIELLFNTLVLVVLVATIVNLVYRLPERAADHHRAIHSLTAFIRDVEDMVELANAELASLSIGDLERVRERYKGMVSSLPPSTDKEFIRSKKDYAKKKKASQAISRGLGSSLAHTEATDNESRLKEILKSSPDRIELLRIVERAGSDLWVTGGFVRNLVWDDLHHYSIITQLDDVDVIYFDSGGQKSLWDSKYRALRTAAPNVDWSLKNQAKMKDPWLPASPRSLEEALRCFTDTATAVAVRLVKEDIEILAPYGLDDLFNLVVRPTPGFDPATYRARIHKKNWQKTWPNISIEGT